MAPLSAFVQKEGWRVSHFKGKYANRLIVLIQAIWLKGTRKMYVNKKLIVVTLTLGSRLRQGLAKVQAKSEARKPHSMLLGAWESVRE
jgi:hypothetical protein